MFNNIIDSDKNDALTYHNSLYNNSIPRKWHSNNLEILINNIELKLCENITIVDYGTGTGGSAIEIVKLLEKHNIQKYKLYLVDVLESWFFHAYNLFKNNNNIEFILLTKKINGKLEFLNINDFIKEKIDIFICANTIHLLKKKNIIKLTNDIYNLLDNNGLFLINSGDINIVDEYNLNNFSRKLFLEIINKYISDDNKENIIQKCNKIYPKNINIEELVSILNKFFKIDIYNKNINMELEELIDFYKTPRLNNFVNTNYENISAILKKIYNNDIFIWNYLICKKL